MRIFADKPKATPQTTSTRFIIPCRAHFGHGHDVNSILLQRTIGNQAVQRLLEANKGDVKKGSGAIESVRQGHNFSIIPEYSLRKENIQTKLPFNELGDHYEQEANSVADRVMRMSESEIRSQQTGVAVLHDQSGPTENIQRLSADRDPSLENAVVIEGEEKNKIEKGQVQTLRPLGKTSGLQAISKDLLNSSQGSVQLRSDVRQFMESRFGADFSEVQAHVGGRAAELAQLLSARAFTYGRHIYFNEGEYQPETQEGKRVLAHELTHVIQQRGSQARLPAQKHVNETWGANVPSTVQRLGQLGKSLSHNVAPWGSGPTGSNYEVSTDAGSTVTGWRAYSPWQYQYQYWCHGHSLGTFYKYGYSVYSGSPMAKVVKDEWTNISPNQTKAGDIAVWTANYNHSALFTDPVIEKGQLMPDKSKLSTKNGQNSLAVTTLTDIAGNYGSDGIGVFRRK